jgi:hypothetical protein
MRSPEQLDTIRRLNDAARSNPGTASIANVTLGFQSLPDADRFAALAAIVRFPGSTETMTPMGNMISARSIASRRRVDAGAAQRREDDGVVSEKGEK